MLEVAAKTKVKVFSLLATNLIGPTLVQLRSGRLNDLHRLGGLALLFPDFRGRGFMPGSA